MKRLINSSGISLTVYRLTLVNFDDFGFVLVRETRLNLERKAYHASHLSLAIETN